VLLSALTPEVIDEPVGKDQADDPAASTASTSPPSTAPVLQ
jgi:hypothetical protein